MSKALNILSGNRLNATIAGLQNRLSNCVDRIAAVKHQSETELERLSGLHQAALSDLKQQHASEMVTKITEADEESDATWTQFDRMTLQSIQSQKQKIIELRKSNAKARKLIAANAEQAVLTAQDEAKSERSRLQTTLDANKDFLRKQKREADLIRNQASQLLAKRHIDAAKFFNASLPDITIASHENFESIKALVHREMSQGKQILNNLQKHPTSRFTDSWMLWCLAAAIALAMATIAWFVNAQLAPITAFLVSFAVFGVTVILGGIVLILAVRPMIKSYARSQLPQLDATFRTLECYVDRGEQHLQNKYGEHVASLATNLQEKVANIKSEAAAEIDQLDKKLSEDLASIHRQQANKRLELNNAFEESLVSVETNAKRTMAAFHANSQERLRTFTRESKAEIATVKETEKNATAYMRNRLKGALSKTDDRFRRLRTSLGQFCSSWPVNPEEILTLPRGQNALAYLPLGDLELSLGADVSEILAESGSKPLQAQVPVVFKMVEHGSLIIKADAKQQSLAQNVLRNFVLRAFHSLPAGALQVTIIDPDGLGREFSHLMQLADTDPTMVNHRVWTQATHITEQLARLSHHTEDVIQQLLRDRYKDIREYNNEAGSMSEPYRLVVWSRFPAGVDETSWRYLSSLLSSGGRCGVSVVLLVDTDFPVPTCVDIQRLDESGLTIRIQSDVNGQPQAFVVADALRAFPIHFESPPAAPVQQLVLKQCAEDALRANRVEVAFDTVVPNTLSRYQSKSAHGLSIPVGHAGVGRSQAFRLGHGTAQHVLVAGKTGSGKSSFLHTLVTSAAIHYGPDELRLVLLDFKKGVEFQVYSETNLPHADIIGIESQREFGVSTFEYIDRVMQTRGEAFRSAGVQDIPSWCARHPEVSMPRILVVVDEFQEIFTDDDKLGQHAAMLLDRIVRQGRSFGIHVVLASQTLGGAYSLPRTTLAQMAVRVALQCEGSDAMMILSEDNLAAERLRHAGQAIYNDQSGRVEGNQPFQVAFLSKEKQRELLASLPASTRNSDPMHGGLERCIVFAGHKKATWDDASVAKTLVSVQAKSPSSPAVLLGESVSIEPVVSINLHRQAGQNVLLVGSDDENGASVLRSIMSSFQMKPAGTLSARKLTVIDASREEDSFSFELARRLFGTESHVKLFGIQQADQAIEEVYRRMQQRMAEQNEDGSQGETRPNASNLGAVDELLVVPHLGRLRSLRKNEEFSFGDDASEIKPDKMLQEILREGPMVGIHVLLWADNANTFNRWLPRQATHDIEYRALMQMSSNDSNHLIDSAAANRLDKNVLLLYEDSSGQTRKFRPFEIDAVKRSS